MEVKKREKALREISRIAQRLTGCIAPGDGIWWRWSGPAGYGDYRGEVVAVHADAFGVPKEVRDAPSTVVHFNRKIGCADGLIVKRKCADGRWHYYSPRLCSVIKHWAPLRPFRARLRPEAVN